MVDCKCITFTVTPLNLQMQEKRQKELWMMIKVSAINRYLAQCSVHGHPLWLMQVVNVHQQPL